jgi:hypothetical protein
MALYKVCITKKTETFAHVEVHALNDQEARILARRIALEADDPWKENKSEQAKNLRWTEGEKPKYIPTI